ALRLDATGHRLARLNLRAPVDGVVSTRDVEQAAGRHLGEGETFCAIDQLDTVQLAVSATESDIEEIRPGVAVRILSRAYPTETLRAAVLAVSPVAVPPEPEQERALDLVQRVNLVRVRVEVDNAAQRLRPGMTGRVQFLTEPRSPAGKVAWRLRRWASLIVW
ncbi:MAG TPA: efflux RND transporter periplasmic adaptor subunit, partial [Candidatus Polarisedimenticolaceae bacterium]|nr:efflux RND transporter periplasmic adaptor subunit [Candidatus Polarisedimenticolaceae bacterium]